MKDKLTPWLVGMISLGLASFFLITVLVEIYGEHIGWIMYLTGLAGFCLLILFMIGIKAWIDPLIAKFIDWASWNE